MKRRFFKYSFVLALAAFGLGLGLPADAASLSVRPASQVVAEGSLITVRVVVSTDEDRINAGQGSLTYDPNLFSLQGISTQGTIANLWVEEPASVSAGQIRWSGGIFNPGYKGSDGLLFTVTFKALAAGTAEVRFASGAVLAADGEGTNVLNAFDHGRYQIVSAKAAPLSGAPTPPPAAPALAEPALPPAPVSPNGPVVSSTTHPNASQWYNATTFKARWPLDPKASGVSFKLDEQSLSNPGPVSDGLISEKTFPDLTDGVHYFHLKFIFGEGASKTFSAITHFKVQTDTTPPDLNVVASKAVNRFRQPVLSLSARDALAGLNYYEIQVGAGAVFSVDATETEFTLPIARSGTYAVTVKAVDKAGNSAASTLTVVANVLEPPTIINFPAQPLLGEPITITGKAEPASIVRWLMNGESGSAAADKEGFWSLNIARSLPAGQYEWRFSQRNTLGAESGESEPRYMEVINFIRVGSVVVPMRIFAALTVVIVLILLGGAFSLWRSYQRLKQKLARSRLDIEEKVTLELEELKEFAIKRVESIKRLKGKRALSKAEEQLETALIKAIEHIKKNVRRKK